MKKENGFTLVELAISLMVIGLLIGGVLKGQELIDNARVTQAVREIDSYKAATLLFLNTFGDLPGDIRNPASRLPNCSAANCNLSGNANGIVFNSSAPANQEQYNFFCHLAAAGMIATTVAPLPCNTGTWSTYARSSSLNGYMATDYVIATGAANTETVALSDSRFFQQLRIGERRQLGLRATTAYAIDQKMDDGMPTKGAVQIRTYNSPTCVTTDTIPEYNIAITTPSCALGIAMPYVE